MTKHYSDKPVAEWNVKNMLDYLADEHKRRFGVDYQPAGTWASERGMLGNWIGTKRKAGKYGAEFTKRFIEECLSSYRPTAQYPGMAFGFMVAYRKQVIQRLQLEMMREEAAQADTVADIDDDWL